MATYKVLQDIEAEDKLIGPLSLRQFIYAGASVVCFYLSFLAITKHAAYLLALFLPIALFSGFFAVPWGRDQPTEIWALAKIRFFLKPRRRIWDQSGTKELVSVTVPKKIEQFYTNGLSPIEVNSRLRALANTIDSRGWAIKNVNVNLYSQPALVMAEPDSDRLVSVSALPQTVPDDDITASDDIMDEQNNRVAQQFNSMIEASTKAHRQEILDKLQTTQSNAAPRPATASKPQPTNNYWFLSQPNQAAASVPQNAVTFNAQVVTPGAGTNDLPVTAGTPTQDEENLVRQLEQHRSTGVNAYSHLHTIVPLGSQPTAPPASAVIPAPLQPPQNPQAPQMPPAQNPQPASPAPTDPAILSLASNDDLNVATIARQANKQLETSQDEVVISLH